MGRILTGNFVYAEDEQTNDGTVRLTLAWKHLDGSMKTAFVIVREPHGPGTVLSFPALVPTPETELG
jgi:hypothetical protein